MYARKRNALEGIALRLYPRHFGIPHCDSMLEGTTALSQSAGAVQRYINCPLRKDVYILVITKIFS